MDLETIIELTRGGVIRWQRLPRLEQDTNCYKSSYENHNLTLEVFRGGAHWVSIGGYKLQVASNSKVEEYRYNYHCEDYQGGRDLEHGDKKLVDLHKLIED